MPNAAIPVPQDLTFERTAPDKGLITFHSTGDALIYDVRFGIGSVFWHIDHQQFVTGPHPKDARIELIVDLMGLEPDASSPPTYFFIVAKDPTLSTDQFSFIYPPPPNGGENYGQGPGVRYDWGDWVEPEIPVEVPVQLFSFSPVRDGDTVVRLVWEPVGLDVRFYIDLAGVRSVSPWITDKVRVSLGVGRALVEGESFHIQSQTVLDGVEGALEPPAPGQAVSVGPKLVTPPVEDPVEPPPIEEPPPPPPPVEPPPSTPFPALELVDELTGIRYVVSPVAAVAPGSPWQLCVVSALGASE